MPGGKFLELSDSFFVLLDPLEPNRIIHSRMDLCLFDVPFKTFVPKIFNRLQKLIDSMIMDIRIKS
jgi:hypothetical protein